MSYTDTSHVVGDPDQYRVLAQNTVGDTWNYATNGNELDPNTYAYPVVTTQSEWVYSNPITNPPAAPSGLNASLVPPAQVDLDWTDNANIPNNEDGFVVERSTDAGATWNQIGQAAADATTFSDITVVPGNSYEYQVYAFNANGSSAPAVSAQVVVPDVVPADPTNLMATTVTSTQVDMAWTDNSNNEDGFRIELSDGLGGWIEIGQTAAGVTTFSVTGLTSGTSYSYRVYAFNAVGDSANPTNTLDVTTPAGTPPAAPSMLLVTNRTASSLTVSWQDNSGNEDGFAVQIATDKNFSRSVQTFLVAADVTQYQFYPLAPNTKYYIRVSAYNAAGDSWSAAISDKTLK
jgi:hypothetical protein